MANSKTVGAEVKPGSLLKFLKRDGIDAEFLEAYRKLLVGQYQTLYVTSDNTEAKKEAERILDIPRGDIEWEDLYRLELVIVKLESNEMLRRRAWILRNEYKEMASPDEFKDYIASDPPEADEPDIEVLRADLAHLQEELNWRYLVIWVLEAVRGRIIRGLLYFNLPAILLFLLLSQVVWFAQWTSDHLSLNLPLLGFIIAGGVIGGLVSTLQRVQSSVFNKNADLDLSELLKGNVGIYLSPVFGGIFAVLLFFIFAGELIMGDVFPKISTDMLFVYPPGEEFFDGEFAKIVVWSFIAGFAERFVPDNLQRLAKSGANSSEQPKSKKKP